MALSKIGKYEIRRQIGLGGFGKVYEAYDPTVKRQVAIKVLASAGDDPDVLARFRNEATSAGNLRHKNIVTIYEYGEQDKVPFIVMEYVEGEDLQRIISTGRPLSLVARVRIMTEVAEGLRYAHDHGVAHRDIKPGNIMIQPDGAVKIMDFGIARLLHQDSSRLTQQGSILGTLLYMAPEAFAGVDAGYQGDIFAYGVTFYEFLSGKHPFAAPDPRALMYNIVQSEPEPLTTVLPDCPESLQLIVHRALAKDPQLRYQSMLELLLDCETVLSDLSGQEAAELLETARSALDSGNLDTAQSSVRQALARDPANRQAREIREKVQGQLQQQSLRAKSDTLRRANALIDAHRLAEAAECLDAAKKSYPGDAAFEALLSKVHALGEETQQSLQRPEEPPEPAPLEPPPPPEAAPRMPSLQPDGVGEFTRVFSTRPAAASPGPVSTPPPAAPPVESTRMFVISRPAQGPAAPVPGEEEPPGDTILTISDCVDSALLGNKVDLQRFPFTIGRSDADWKLPFDAAVSARHAEIDYRQGGFFIRDLNSANGTFVNGQRLAPMRHEVLLFGARILLGSNTELVFGLGKSQEIPDLQGQLIGNRFTLVQMLHSSNKSVLYLARDENLSRQVVIKLLSPSLIRHAGYRDQFKREAHTASLLRHAHICQVLDYGEVRLAQIGGLQSLYVCMEYLPGGSLQAKLKRAEVIPLERTAAWLDTICDALGYIHARGIVHAGIKPSAIVFDAEDNAYVTDFAFATRRGEGDRHTVVGAPAFLAPEQWDGAEPVPATDQYSLAVLLYWLIGGMPPFEGQEHFAVRKRNLQRGPEPVHAIAAQNRRPSLPPAVSPVLQKALAINAAERFASTADFATAFRLALSATAASRAGPPSVFISYQRTVSSAWALLLKREMERERTFQVFVDAEQQDSSGQFPLKLQRRIQQCDVFICLLADSTLASDWVRREIQLAWETGKPMIPVFQESYRDPANLRALEPHIQELLTYDGVKLLDRQNIYFDAAIQALMASTKRSVEAGAAQPHVPRAQQLAPPPSGEVDSHRTASPDPTSPEPFRTFAQRLKAWLRAFVRGFFQ